MDLLRRYEATMVLSGAGDAVGYKKGEWEFCRVGLVIHEQLKELGGIHRISINKDDWPVSDDTVMHIATGKALVQETAGESKEELFARIAREYKDCMALMDGRQPGGTCMTHALTLEPEKPLGYVIPFDEKGGGCGAAMRAMCIGLRYPHPEDLQDLICVSIESGRMTHHHPTGYLGSLASALFTSYAIQGKPVESWGSELVNLLPKALDYICEVNREVEENKKHWGYFEKRWRQYIEKREITDGKSKPKFPFIYDVEQRDEYYKSISFYKSSGGHSGHDAPMIAYDAILGCDGTWKDLCDRAMFHSGDSDSTGAIAGALFGAVYGFKSVNKRNYAQLEFREELMAIAKQLFKLSHPDQAHLADDAGSKCAVA